MNYQYRHRCHTRNTRWIIKRWADGTVWNVSRNMGRQLREAYPKGLAHHVVREGEPARYGYLLPVRLGENRADVVKEYLNSRHIPFKPDA